MMEVTVLVLVAVAFVCWAGVLLVPWRPWLYRERLEVNPDTAEPESFPKLTVLIPARNEADVLSNTLASLRRQACSASVIVVDDQSDDDTAAVAEAQGANVIQGVPLPSGWTGKLWALEQGRQQATSDWLLLLDADIELKPGTLAALWRRACRGNCQFVSVMAWLRMESVWERLLMPAFIYFFKLLYPFALSNSPRSRVAAAAGGCVLIDAHVLAELGGFGVIRDAVIDDCSLAKAVKNHGYRTWIGVSRSVVSQREYPSLGSIWEMVTRTAFTQLRYSSTLLGGCTLMLVLVFWVPIAGLFWPTSLWVAVAAWIAMALSYWPTLRYYNRSPLWCITLPLTGTLYLAMTWHSAWRYWRGVRSRWKNRDYHSQTI